MVIPLNERPRSGPYSGINARSAKRFLTEQFKAAKFSDPEGDARELVMEATGFSLTDFALRGIEFLTPEQFDRVKAMADRRMSGEPVDMILGWREFYGRQFKVTKDVLSPRGDTEVLVNCGLESVKDQEASHILDLGTGSGAVLVTLLAELENATGLGVDISENALNIAIQNAQKNNVTSNITFQKSDWFEAVEGVFDLIVSNPPYITDEAMKGLDKDVVNYDPDLALRGGTSGLDPYPIIIGQSKNYLKQGAALWVEIGFDQGSAIKTMFIEHGFRYVQIVKDLSGHDRCVGGIF